MSDNKERSLNDLMPWAVEPSEERTITQDIFSLPSGSDEAARESRQGPALWREMPEWARTAQPSARDVLTAFTTGVARGGTELTPAAGALAGAQIGLRTPPVSPVVNPFTGGLAGTAAGYFAGLQAQRAAEEMLPETRDDVKGYQEAGKTLAQNLLLGTGMVGLAGRARTPVEVATEAAMQNMPRTSLEWIKSFLNAPFEFARRSPRSALATEAASSVGAATGAGIAESYYPGEPGTRLGAEIVGGVLPGFTPAGILLTQSDNISNVFRRSVGRATAERKASDYLNRLYTTANEDIDAARRMLSQEQPPAVTAFDPRGMTSAQLTGLPIMSALERTLSRGNATTSRQFSVEVDQRGKNAINAFYGVLKDLGKEGSPEALQLAATMRRDYAVGLLQNRFDLAQKNVADAIARFHQSGGVSGERDWGKLLKEQVDSAITDIRGYEKDLWKTATRSLYERTPKTGQIRIKQGLAQPLKVTPDNTLRAYYEMRAVDPDIQLPGIFRRDMIRAQGITDDDLARYMQGKRSREVVLGEQPVPDRFFKREDEAGDLVNYTPISADQLIDMRSQILGEMRDAQGKGEYRNANFLNKLQAGILDDLSSLNLPQFDTAKAFSRQLNDTFTRTFVDDIAAVDPSGALRIAPEILSAKVIGAGRAGRTMTDLRMQEIEDAMKMVSATAQQRYARAATELGDNPSQAQLAELGKLEDAVLLSQGRVSSVMEGNARLLRMMASESVDDAGNLNPAKLSRFINDYGPALDRYGLTPDLTDAVKAQSLLDAAGDPNSYLNRVSRSQAAFAQVLEYESPIRAVEAATKSRFPVRDLTNIAKLAQKGGPEAVNGLRSILFDIAYNRGITASGDINIDAYKSTFFSPVDRGAPSLATIMQRQGILTEQDIKTMRGTISSIDRVIASMTTPETVADLLKTNSPLVDAAVRIGGARLGSAISAVLPGPGNIQTPGIVSGMAKSMFLKEPSVLFKGVIEEAMLNPKFQAELLSRPRSASERFELSRRLHAYLYAAGLRYATFDEEPPQEEEAPVSRAAPPPPMFRAPPTAPTTRGVPGLAPPGGQQGPQSQGGAPQGNARAMLQSLFPFDATLAGMPLQTPPGAPPTGP